MTEAPTSKKTALQNLCGKYLEFAVGAFTTLELCGADHVCA
jgi:hypothetical protein